MVSEAYEAQVDLLLEVLPAVAKHRDFAIKGGTALNLFYLDMPRLSVDIDLCYLPIKDRDESFAEIHRILGKIKREIEHAFGFDVQSNRPLDGKRETRLQVNRNGTVIKVEPNYTLRGSLYPTQVRDVAEATQEHFEKSASAQLLDPSDLYGGKFCAALDRQHPRDLFDVRNYFQTHEITPKIKDSFIFYLLSHNRPMHELLGARELSIGDSYERDFRGMCREDVPVAELISARKKLKSELLSSFEDRDRRFLLSFANNAPDWGNYNHPQIKDYPSIRWKLFNLDRMAAAKRAEQQKLLAAVLNRLD